VSLKQDHSSSCYRHHQWASHRVKMCPLVSTAAIVWLGRLTCGAERIGRKSCGRQVRGRVPNHVNCLLDVTLKNVRLLVRAAARRAQKKSFPCASPVHETAAVSKTNYVALARPAGSMAPSMSRLRR
jgi:hypothetical protein